MTNLRSIRIFVTTLFLAAAVAYAAVGLTRNPMLEAVKEVQIILSAIEATFGVALFWLAATFIFGRVYCSSVCPVGTLQDLVIGLRRRLPGRKPLFHYKSASGMRWVVLIVYLACLVAGVSFVIAIWEPWSMFCNIASITDDQQALLNWGRLGLNASAAFVAAGVISLVALFLSAAFLGRDYCNVACPIGIGLGAVSKVALYQIQIDPDKCINCMKCEEECKAGCIKVVNRYVDNSRCVRCFDCISHCPNNAIQYRRGRFKASTPLMNRVS